MTPDGKYVYVTNSSDGYTSIIDMLSLTVQTVAASFFGDPASVCISPDGDFVYTANKFGNNVDVINTATNMIVTSIPVGSRPEGIDISADGAFLYVVNNISETVSVIDVASSSVVHTIGIGTYPIAYGDFVQQTVQNITSPAAYIPSPGDVVDVTFTDATTGCTSSTTITFQVNTCLSAKVFLQGALDGANMSDALRAGGMIDVAEPYAASGYTHIGGGGETTTLEVLSVTGAMAVVDWVVIELRNPTNSSVIMESRSALLLSNGMVVDPSDGVSAVRFTVLPGNYYVAIRHRNHLGVMTSAAIGL